MYGLLRPLLFALPPELAHALALWLLRIYGRWWRKDRQTGDVRAVRARASSARTGALVEDASPASGRLSCSRPKSSASAAPGDSVRLFGLAFANRIGLAAGLDKDATAVLGLARLGFGFLEVGSVTPRPQPGNPRPRLFRLRQDGALINRMGFNSAGMEAVAARLRTARERLGVPIGVNIGKNADTPLALAAEDYAKCLTAVYDVADYVAVNLSSPNTPGLRDLQAAATVRTLLGTLVATRDSLAASRRCPLPLLVKIAPDLVAKDLEDCAVAALEAGADGLIAVNTTVRRPPTLRSRHAEQQGGLSGAPLFPIALQTVQRLRRCIGPDPALVAVGGVGSAVDVSAMLNAGADLVQVYSALIYRGPGLVDELLRNPDTLPDAQPQPADHASA